MHHISLCFTQKALDVNIIIFSMRGAKEHAFPIVVYEALGELYTSPVLLLKVHGAATHGSDPGNPPFYRRVWGSFPWNVWLKPQRLGYPPR